MPRAGFAVMPERASEPPHSSARLIASTGAGCALRAGGHRRRVARRAAPRPRIVPALPPQPASVTNSMRSARAAPAAASSAAESSRPIRTVAATFACVAKPSSTRSTRAMSISDPRPVQSWLTATAPGCRAATCSAAAQAAACRGRTSTWLRKPQRPSPPLIADEVHGHMLIARRSSAKTREPRVSAAVGEPARTADDLRPQLVDRRVRPRDRSRRRAPRAAGEEPGDRDHRADREADRSIVERREGDDRPGLRRRPARRAAGLRGPRRSAPSTIARAAPRRRPGTNAVDPSGRSSAASPLHDRRALGERAPANAAASGLACEASMPITTVGDGRSRVRLRRDRLQHGPRRPRRHGSRMRANRRATGCRRARPGDRARRWRRPATSPGRSRSRG